MEANTINNQVEEKDFLACPNDKMTKSDDEKKNMIPETPCPKDVMTNDEENQLHQGQKQAPKMQATHLGKLALLSMSNI